MTTHTIVAIYLGLIIGGFIIESLVSQTHFLLFGKQFKKYHYKFGRYLFYLMFPVVALVFSLFFASPEVLSIFLAFSVIGPALEWLAGFSYHMVVGQRLWTYHRYSIGGYTSFFTIPLWGLAGILFWLLNKVI